MVLQSLVSTASFAALALFAVSRCNRLHKLKRYWRCSGRVPPSAIGARANVADRRKRPSTETLRAPDRQRLYEQLAARLLDYVEITGLSVGDRLPSERDLAQALQVSRASVRQATVALEVRGTLEVRHGDGIYLRARPSGNDDLGELMRLRLPDVLDAREALETHLAALAAVRRTDSDIELMNSALDEMATDIASGGIGEDGDRLFHESVTSAAKSPLLAGFMAVLAPAIAESRRSSLGEPGRPPRSLASHRRIAEAIAAGDESRARLAMRRHLKMVADVGLLRWLTGGAPG